MAENKVRDKASTAPEDHAVMGDDDCKLDLTAIRDLMDLSLQLMSVTNVQLGFLRRDQLRKFFSKEYNNLF